jgi:hypothetical protein
MTRRIGWTMALVVGSLLTGSHLAKADLLTINYNKGDLTDLQKSLVDDAIKEWTDCLLGSPKGQPITLTLSFTFKPLPAPELGGTSNIKADGNNNPQSADIEISTGANMYYGLGLPVPKDKFDALSIIKHELGHALGFAGGDPKDGLGYAKWNAQLSADDPPIFDKGGLNVTMAGTDANGRSHIAQGNPRDLMNPVPVDMGERRGPSNLDFQMLGKAFGYQVCPEPSSLAIACIGSLGMLGVGIRRRRRAIAA